MPGITIHPLGKGTWTHPMNTRTRHGYTRLIRDLAELDHDARFQEMLDRAYGAMDELGQLINRTKQLSEQENEGNPPSQE